MRVSSLAGEGVDVLVDAGRLGAAHAPGPLLRRADAVLVLTRTQLPTVAATRARAAGLRQDMNGAGGDDRVGLLLVGEGRPYTAREIGKAVSLPVLGAIAWDPAAAEVLSVGAPRPRRWEASTFVRSAPSCAEATGALVSHRRFTLGNGSPPAGPSAAPNSAVLNGMAWSMISGGGGGGGG